ncbi:MAG: phosphoribosylformylglycinamidine synthase subunit PurQ [Spirochaetes bacterium]|nr:phosphoribosylformylglycinamidine synthase subunit PurQ [Spirochaetota bacterium]MBN2769837.1 phosphoribosylformylglycinamidine synthase subunit PurQ [Spirochaetota bacterium]
MKKVRALVITGFGINCEEEMAAAYTLAGAEAVIVHLNDILVDGFSIHDFDVLNFPGGFSFGDDIASGRVLANKIRFKKLPSGLTFIDEIKKFIKAGKFVFGVCNGFQVLVKLGLLPDLSGEIKQEVTLTRNDSSKFEDRWCYCKRADNVKTPFLKDIDIIYLPVRHGEGKLMIADDNVQKKILDNNLAVLSYCDSTGKITDKYPLNPNGSEMSIAGLTDTTGQVFGLMPHPEAFLTLYNHPDWGRLRRENPSIPEDGEGLKIFKNIITHIASQERKDEVS